MVTTESATLAATWANLLVGSCSSLAPVCSVTFEVVKAGMISAVLLPITPPMPPITSATITMTPSATHDTRPPNSTSRTPSLPIGAPPAATGAGCGCAGTPSDGDGRRVTPRIGGLLGQGRGRARPAARPRRPDGAAECPMTRRDGRTRRRGRGRAPDPSGCTRPGRGARRRRGTNRVKPSGRPKARVCAGSTGGRETGRGSIRGRLPDWSWLVTRVHSPSERAPSPAHAIAFGRTFTLPALAARTRYVSGELADRRPRPEAPAAPDAGSATTRQATTSG